MITVTTNDLPGQRIVRVRGLLRSQTLRARQVAGNPCRIVPSPVGTPGADHVTPVRDAPAHGKSAALERASC